MIPKDFLTHNIPKLIYTHIHPPRILISNVFEYFIPIRRMVSDPLCGFLGIRQTAPTPTNRPNKEIYTRNGVSLDPQCVCALRIKRIFHARY